VARPQGVPVAQASPSHTRSLEPQVVGEALADDASTATPLRGAVENVVTSPPVADARVGTPPRVAEVVGTSAGDVGATASPSGRFLVGMRAWSGTSLRSTWRQKARKHLEHRYFHLHLQAQGCHGAPLIGITPFGRRIGLRITKTCKPCRPTSSPSTTR
jgi:hypothetical protein